MGETNLSRKIHIIGTGMPFEVRVVYPVMAFGPGNHRGLWRVRLTNATGLSAAATRTD